MTFFATIRGVEIEVFAEDFDGDESVGRSYAPEVLYAKTLDGEEFGLTEEEVEVLTIEAIDRYYDTD